MKKISAKEVYYKFFNYLKEEWKPCEVCNGTFEEAHHINCKGMGGTNNLEIEHIENYIGVCRKCHIDYGDKKQHTEFLKQKHKTFIRLHWPDYKFEIL